MKRLTKSCSAFTLVESLLTLAITSFLILSLSGVVATVFQSMEEKLFFLSFEHLYRDTQKMSAAYQESRELIISPSEVSNGEERLLVPPHIKPLETVRLSFDKGGGNSSLGKIRFQTQGRLISYQLYLGSGHYKKTED